jgi:AcrR family transcriptional regulator
MPPERRKKQILKAAVAVAIREGFAAMTREQVAARANVSGPLVSQYFTSMAELRDAVVRYALEHSIQRILGQAIAHGSPLVTELSQAARKKALASLS